MTPITSEAEPQRGAANTVGLLVVIGTMCAAQGLVFNFSGAVMGTVARSNGLPLESFWLLSLAMVPFWAKVLWAPLVDRYGHAGFGRRRSWIVPCTLLAGSTLLVLGELPPQPGGFVIAFVVFTTALVLMTTQDIAVDAYCIENLRVHNFHAGTTTKMVCEALGSAAAAWGLLTVYQHAGWRPTLWAATGLLWLLTAVVLIRREQPQQVTALAGAQRPRASLRRFFCRAHVAPLALVMAVGGFLNQSVLSVWGALLIDQKMSIAQVAAVVGAAAFIGEVTAVVLANVLAARVGVRLSFGVLALAGPLLLVPLWVVASGPGAGGPWLWLAGVTMPFVFALLHASLTIERMKWSAGSQVATDFTAFGLFYNLGRTAAPVLAGLTAATLGWGVYVVIVALLYGAFALACSGWLWRYGLAGGGSGRAALIA